MSGKSFVSCAVLAVVLCACRGPAAERPADSRYETIRPEWRSPEGEPSREWLRFSVGFLDRTAPSNDPIDDSIALGIDGGFDLSRTVLTPSIELGIGYTAAHVSLPDAKNLDIWQANAGMRGTWYAKGWRPFVRAGGFVRWTTDDEEEPLDPYATGVYFGIGADWPYQGMWLGPSVTYYRALDEDSPAGDSEEILFALSATFRM